MVMSTGQSGARAPLQQRFGEWMLYSAGSAYQVNVAYNEIMARQS